MDRPCSTTDNGNRAVTNSVYFVLRSLATMALACVFIMLDAQTIQMCSHEAAQGRTGSYGRQIVYKTLAQVGGKSDINWKVYWLDPGHGFGLNC